MEWAIIIFLYIKWGMVKQEYMLNGKYGHAYISNMNMIADTVITALAHPLPMRAVVPATGRRVLRVRADPCARGVATDDLAPPGPTNHAAPAVHDFAIRHFPQPKRSPE